MVKLLNNGVRGFLQEALTQVYVVEDRLQGIALARSLPAGSNDAHQPADSLHFSLRSPRSGPTRENSKTPGEDPYRRKIPTFKAVMDSDVGGEVVKIGRIALDQSEFQSRYEPGHPAADANGYVKYPNVNALVETMDMREAQRSYEANLNVVTVTRQMLGATIDILKG